MKTLRFYGYLIFTLLTKKRLLDRLYKKHSSGENVENEFDKIVKKVTKKLVKISGSTVTVKGLEQLSPEENYLFVGNHQGNMDIITLLAVTPHSLGFIAKKELLKLPVIGQAMHLKNCIFLDREDNRQAVKDFNQAIKLLKNGTNLVIFPEGTRSKSNEINEFRPGALRLAIKSGVKVVPVTMKNTYKVMEENKGRITPAHIHVTFSEPVESSRFDNAKELSEEIEKIVRLNM